MRPLLIAALPPLLIAADKSPRPSPFAPEKARPVCARSALLPAQNGVVDGTRMVRPRRLDEMPPAKQQLAVIRSVGGCSIPTVVRDNIGGR